MVQYSGELRGETHSAQWIRNPKHNSVRFWTGSPLGRFSSPVSTGPVRLVRENVIACPLARGTARVSRLRVCFSVTLRSGRVCFHNLSGGHHQGSPLKPPQPLCCSAQHMCVFSSFLLQVKGCHLARGKESTCDTGSWQG